MNKFQIVKVIFNVFKLDIVIHYSTIGSLMTKPGYGVFFLHANGNWYHLHCIFF